jgi:hypothetical protein
MSILGALETLRKATISFVTSVRLSVRMEQLRSHWTDFHEIWCFTIFRKSINKIQVSVKSEKNGGHFRRTPIHIFYHSVFISSWNKKCFRKCYRENQTHILCSFFFRKSCRLWENVKYNAERGRPQMTIWRMPIACWIRKLLIHTLRLCNTDYFSTATVVARTRLSVTLNVHCVSCCMLY